MIGEPVHLVRGEHRCHSRWERVGYSGGPFAAVISTGTLVDGRWWVLVVHQVHKPAHAYPTQAQARQVVQQWMRHIGGDWQQVPCYPTDGWQPGEQDQPSTDAHS